MMEFEKGENEIRIDDAGYQANLSLALKVKEKASAYLVDIPALNIHFYVKDKQDIEKSTHESLVSFFNFWIHKKSFDHFLKHVSALGFMPRESNLSKVAEPQEPYRSFTQVKIDRLIWS